MRISNQRAEPKSGGSSLREMGIRNGRYMGCTIIVHLHIIRRELREATPLNATNRYNRYIGTYQYRNRIITFESQRLMGGNVLLIGTEVPMFESGGGRA